MAIFAQIWAKVNLPGKQSLPVFNYLLSCQKSEKTNEPFLRNMLRWQTDRQTNNNDFIGPSVGWESN